METKESKALRWLAANFPLIETPKSNEEKICSCIHLYCSAAADRLEELEERLTACEDAETASEKKKPGISQSTM